ncbi:hypothetical protein EG329_001918 [Mollisiaceae sp. DMI_Dod_QoI]|nr:hypothetical protein EG329_001918 [Helotiales sp. DMI_Dod_QoI]
MPSRGGTDWAIEMSKNNRMPATKDEMVDFIKQMDELGLKGAYNPKNTYPGSAFTPSSLPKPEEVRQQAKYGTERVLSNWETLRKIVERHAEVLEKRWIKKTRKKQKELLLQAWPNMSSSHRPDYEAYRAENTGRRWTGLSSFQDAYKWPYINQQDLSSKSLIIFINSRGRHPPSMFARADINATRLGSIGHFIPEPAFLQGYTLFMDGETTETYGKLVSWEDDETAADLMFSERQFSPGDGLRVLELQEKVYPFLIKCCKLILHDLVESGLLLDDQFLAVPETVSAKEPDHATSTEMLPSLATLSAEAPYRLPANLDLDRLRGILAARLSAAEDHLWALREDPGYFADTVMDWSEHRNDRLLDTLGNPHPTGPQTTEFWSRVIRNVIADAYNGFETWYLLHRQVNRLRTLKEKYKNDISYDRQLLKSIWLKFSSSSSYLRSAQPGTINMHIRPINELDPHFAKPWGLLLILWDEQQRDLFGLTNVIDAFEQIMQDPAEKRNLSPYMADMFADLAILSRALREIEMYQPWAATFEEEHKNHRGETLKIYEEATFQLKYLENMDMVMNNITQLAMPGDRKFEYPVDKKRTKQTTEKMITAEKNLDIFWFRFDANWKKLAGKTIDKCMGDHAPRKRESGEKMERTMPWVEPIKELKPKGDSTQEPKLWTDNDDKEEKIPVKSKQKVKTKSVGQSIDASAGAAISGAAASEQVDKQPTFKVDKAALKVFNTLFFVPGQSGAPGEIPWIDFLRAMASTGFAAQKLYGSIWQFTPTKLDVERSIQFHEPHPAVKIRFPVARRMGRRLMRAYGWYGGMFELE